MKGSLLNKKNSDKFVTYSFADAIRVRVRVTR